MSAVTTLVGNLTRTPELKYSKSGVAYAKFSVAVNENKKVGDEYESIPHFFDVTAFGDLAENMAETLDTGSKAIVVGKLQYDTWEDDSGKRSKISVIASDIGPSLSNATATVERLEKKTPAKKAPAAKKSQRRPARNESYYDDGEEPF